MQQIYTVKIVKMNPPLLGSAPDKRDITPPLLC